MFSQWACFGRGGPWALTVSLVLLLLGVNLSADTLSPAQALSQRMSALDGMRADIVQKIYANGVVLEESQGTMALAKPNLRWQIDTPLPQVILVRQNELQIYDEDLAQLTIRDWTDAQNETPADVLMEPARLLSGDYSVTYDRRGATEVYRLFSDAPSSFFQLLEIGFADRVLESLVILDWQGQQTQIRFLNVEMVTELPAQLFELSVPQGTDVIRG